MRAGAHEATTVPDSRVDRILQCEDVGTRRAWLEQLVARLDDAQAKERETRFRSAQMAQAIAVIVERAGGRIDVSNTELAARIGDLRFDVEPSGDCALRLKQRANPPHDVTTHRGRIWPPTT